MRFQQNSFDNLKINKFLIIIMIYFQLKIASFLLHIIMINLLGIRKRKLIIGKLLLLVRIQL